MLNGNIKTMKNILKVILLILPACLFAQKFNQVNHGATYEQIKEVDPKVFKRNCDGFLSGSSYRFPYMFTAVPIGTVNGYATSKFEGELKNRSEKLWLEYRRKLEALGNEFDNNKMRSLYNDFENCSQKAYDYLQLHLKKFEATAEYYKNVYNFEYDLKSQNDNINLKLRFLSDSLDIVKKEIDFKFKNDSVISDVKNQKNLELITLKSKYPEVPVSNINDYEGKIKAIEDSYNNSVNELEIERKAEFKKLPPENYQNNKQKVINKFAPRFEELRIKRNKEIQSLKDKNSTFISSQKKDNDSKSTQYHNEVSKLELTFEKKIYERENYLKSWKEKEHLELEKYENEQSSKIIKKIKNEYSLDGQLELFENNYQKDIQKTNEEIKILLSKKSKNNKLKEGLKGWLKN
jgi:hypothetical protein